MLKLDQIEGYKLRLMYFGQLNNVLRDLRNKFPLSKITEIFSSQFSSNYDHRISPKWIGSVVRKKLRLSTRKSNGLYVLGENQKETLERLYAKYDL